MGGNTRLALWFALALVATACNRKPETPAVAQDAAPPATAASAPPAVVDPAASFVAAVATGTSPLPLTIRFELPVPPVVGQGARVVLRVASDRSLKRVEIDASSAALLVDPASATLSLDALEAGSPRQLEIAFTPRSAGLADVELDVRVQTDDGELRSRYAIPVLSVDATAAAAAAGG